MTLPCAGLDATGKRFSVPLVMVTGALSVLTRVQVRLQTQRGSWPDDVSLGLPWREWQERGRIPTIEIEAAVRRQVARVSGVLEVVSVSATTVGDDLSVAVTFRFLDEGGTISTAVVGDPAASSALRQGAWYVILKGSANPVNPLCH